MGLTAAIEHAVSRRDDALVSSLDRRIFRDGAVVGQWRILALLGQGGNGEVYRVEHVKSGTLGALKATAPEDNHLRKRFDMELEVLGKIASTRGVSPKHARKLRNLPVLLDSGVAGGASPQKNVPYFVIELLQNLEMPAKSHKVRKMVLDICEAVRQLHKIGYLHRDIKPENIMWRRKGEAVLLDFGLACSMESLANPLSERISMVREHIVGVGTEGSSAPEQLFGHAQVQSDIYALGALIDKAFGGKPPAEWAAVLLKALNPRPECRFDDIDEFTASIKKSVSRFALPGFLRKKWASVFFGVVIFFGIFGIRDSLNRIAPRPDDEDLYRMAVQGNAMAQNELGNYYLGRYEEEAVKWYLKAAEQGLKEAMYNLGTYYYSRDLDNDGRWDRDEAAKWFQMAAEKGLKAAQYDYGRCLYGGEGVKEDRREAEQWMQKAASRGSERALAFLVARYRNGDFNPADRATVAYWLRKAAEQGDVFSQFDLGMCYANGYGVAVDKTEAARWYRIAAEQLLPQAQYELGKCCENGDGVPQDKAGAAMWYRKAAEQGNESAREALRRLGL